MQVFVFGELSQRVNELEINPAAGSIGYLLVFVQSKLYHETRKDIEEHIKKLKAARDIFEGGLAIVSKGRQNQFVSDRDEQRDRVDRLTHAIYGLQMEIIRATERFRSLSEVSTKADLENTERKISMKISELQGNLTQVKEASLKALSEIRRQIDKLDQKIVDLTAQLSDADVPADAQATIAELKAISAQLDDVVPDAPDLPPPGPEPTPPPTANR